uniref:Reverse transcriptase domain-containing protein n=1 Tax=Haemonchus contortus TaxID=6289 RepID=A0A7I4Z3M5_HAECO
MVETFTNEDDDLARWDRYWTMDNSGIYEFAGTKNAEKSAVNQQVLNFFNDTIEKRPDGYYVRLPYKQNHPSLPSNKAIAMKRLWSVLKTLKSDPKLLEEYNNIFETQLNGGIIEEVPIHQSKNSKVIHYIPHQPVVTPHKQTTKLRIVFDASSHSKDCPALNDVLHQGPLILPETYAMLLRFRVPNLVITADVEKAFLQVHLHELDRDATRFFWVRDYKMDLEEGNVVTYRFTRVTFGLNVSPFLLGATINYHLRNAVHDKTIAEEIAEILYVDNLILAADSPKEAIRKALLSKEIFAEMNMNLREFLSNNKSVSEESPEEARASKQTQKVLGIPWDSKHDKLTICCDFPSTVSLTKRTVARQIASVFDPFGWLVPLMVQAKRFQQELWKRNYEWDSALPGDVRDHWNTICSNVHGLQRTLDRRLLNVATHCDLAIFSDASSIAMSASAYIFNDKQSTLVMAKNKLPSIKSNPTIPKMEMNALTIGARLAISIVTALKGSLPQDLNNIHIFSDSQIVLN